LVSRDVGRTREEIRAEVVKERDLKWLSKL
jgi:hypothetical protein